MQLPETMMEGGRKIRRKKQKQRAIIDSLKSPKIYIFNEGADKNQIDDEQFAKNEGTKDRKLKTSKHPNHPSLRDFLRV